MRSYFKGLIFYLIFGVVLMSCSRDKETVTAQAKSEGTREAEDRPKEEEIRYFHMVGIYMASLRPLHLSSNLTELYWDFDVEDLVEKLGEAYKDFTEEDLRSYINIDLILEEDVFHIINLKGDPVAITDIIDQSNFVKIEYKEYGEEEIFFKVKDDLSHYKRAKEYYQIEGGVSNSRKYYCKTPHPQVITKNLTFDDNIFVRLYDKNNQIISENKMKNELFEGVKYYPGSENNLIGMLELPPKDQREGLKYRVVRLKPNGEPSLYFDNEVKNPTQNYIWEEPLPPYSEYKNWDYFEEIGCYVYSRSAPERPDLNIKIGG